MSPIRARAFAACLPILSVLVACENELHLDEPKRLAPPQASVVTSDGTLTVYWTAMDDARDYQVLVSTTATVAGQVSQCEGQGGLTLSPCSVAGASPGQLYYVRVKSRALDGETGEDPKDADLPALAIRAGFPGIPRTPFTWPGIAVQVDEDDSPASSFLLKGMWFADVVSDATHSCFTYWDDEDRELDPCASEELTQENSEAAATLGSDCNSKVCYPVFEVEADDGRASQSYTRARRR